MASTSDGSRGVAGGGHNGTVYVNTIEYITIRTLSDSIDFGNRTVAVGYLASTSNGSKGVFAGGSSSTDTIDYVTIPTKGDAVDFGNLSETMENLAACDDGSRGIYGGGLSADVDPALARALWRYGDDGLDFGDDLQSGGHWFGAGAAGYGLCDQRRADRLGFPL